MAVTQERAIAFKLEREEKIEKLLDEFANGDISREHFKLIYERYIRQLSIAEQALEDGKLDDLTPVMNEISTFVLHAAVRGIAVGMAIIHRSSMLPIRSFGTLEVDKAQLKTIIKNLQEYQQRGLTDFSDMQRLFGNTWLIINMLEYTTLITLFRNEPSAKQVKELERRHRDFESANRNILVQPEPNPDELVYPMALFVS